MRLSARLAVTAFAAFAVLVSACGGSSGASPVSSAITPAPSSDPDAGTYWLRATSPRPCHPLNRFGGQSYAVITGDGQSVTQLALPTVYPGPLLPNLRVAAGHGGRSGGHPEVGERPRAAGRHDGLQRRPGPRRRRQRPDRADRRRAARHASPATRTRSWSASTTPCEPPPGSAAAFAEFWRPLGDLPSWIPNELGPASPYVAPAYAILVGPAPDPGPELHRSRPWTGPSTSRSPCSAGPWPTVPTAVAPPRVRTRTRLRPSLQAANQLTQWVQDLSTSATFGLTVRPMVPGEDICRETFGPA